MIGMGSTPVSAMRPAKMETTDGDGGIQRLRDPAHLFQGEHGGDVQLHARGGEFADEREGGFRAGVGDGDLDVDVPAPAGDFQRLALHLGKLVGKDLEGDGLGRDGLQDVLGEGLVIRDARLVHQGRVRGQALDVGLGVEGKDAGLVGAVGIDPDLEVCRLSMGAVGNQVCGAARIMATASARVRTVKSGFCRRGSA
jgi:hypothetical protein